MNQEDADGDLVGNACDSCSDTADGDNVCAGDVCPANFDPNQDDSYPPAGNGCGNSCECEGNFDGDLDQDGTDAAVFKGDFGRSKISGYPCTSALPCNGDFSCNGNVDGSDAAMFKADFGRSGLSGKPCPSCATDPWCTY
jgi:hypothetical protein